MTCNLETIRTICRVLVFYADRLGRLRASVEHAQNGPAAATYLSAARGSSDDFPWYRVIEPIYEELDHYLRRTNQADCAALFEDRWILANEAKLHRLRACYEFDKEFDQARAVLRAANPTAAVSELIEDQLFWTLTPELCEMLAGSSRVAVLGSGPLPLTALALASTLGLHVTSIDRDGAAVGMASRLIEISGYGALIDTVEGGIDEIVLREPFDAIIGAVLIGVGVEDDTMVCKGKLVEEILALSRQDIPLAIRDPHALGRLYYPAAGLSRSTGLDIRRFDPETGPGLPYRSSMLLIRNTKPHRDHARSSATTVR